jgi:hypothetical protein
MNRPKCVEEMMTTIDYVRYLESENEKLRYSLGVAEMKVGLLSKAIEGHKKERESLTLNSTFDDKKLWEVLE